MRCTRPATKMSLENQMIQRTDGLCLGRRIDGGLDEKYMVGLNQVQAIGAPVERKEQD